MKIIWNFFSGSKNLKSIYAGILALIIIGTIDSHAQSYVLPDSVVITPRLYLSAGGYFPNITTSLRVDSSIGLGTEIGLEDDFNFDQNMSVFRADAILRVSKRSQLAFSYTNLNRNRSLIIDEDVSFGDTTFYAGINAEMKFNVYHFATTWRYSFFDKPNWNAGLSVGLRMISFRASLDAAANSKSYARTSNVNAPALLFGLHGSGYLTPRLLSRYALEFFKVSVSDIDIRVLESQFSLQYFLTKSISLGAGYATNSYLIRDVPLSEDFKGKILFSFDGLNLFVGVRL